MKNRKVVNLRTHVGGWLGMNSYDLEKHEADMELWPVGVFIKSAKGKPCNLLVPFANVIEVQMSEEVAEQVSEEPKRGPGRPPGSRLS